MKAYDLPYNEVTKRPYTGQNIAILLMANDKDMRWAGYDQWLSVGRQVAKDQHCTHILGIVDKIISKEDEPKRYKKAPRSFRVFNYSQTIPIKK